MYWLYPPQGRFPRKVLLYSFGQMAIAMAWLDFGIGALHKLHQQRSLHAGTGT
jgi:hypothetical protein